MRNKNYYINLNDREYLDVLSSLMNKRNKLIQSGKYTDGIDEVIMKIKKACRPRPHRFQTRLPSVCFRDNPYQPWWSARSRQ